MERHLCHVRVKENRSACILKLEFLVRLTLVWHSSRNMFVLKLIHHDVYHDFLCFQECLQDAKQPPDIIHVSETIPLSINT